MSNIPTIFFILIIYRSDSIFNLLGSVKYIITMNLVYFFISFKLWLLENVKIYVWLPLDFYWTTLA